jgi:chaperonin GroEL
VSGAQAQGVTLADLGRARRAWANADTFGIEGGYGDPIALRRRIAQLKTERVDARTEDDRTQTQERLGKLLGGVAILRVGGATPTQQEARKAVAQRAVRALKQALRGGVVPGGGAAYVACRSALDALTAVAHDKVAAHALAAALEEPLAVIARNAGYEPAAVVAQVKSSPPGWGFDARTGTIVDMWAAGIVDPVPVLEAALEAAVSGAIMTLTSDVLVHQRKPFAVAKP